jgi:hypothetical protein
MEGALLLQLGLQARQPVATTPLTAASTPAWDDLLGEELEGDDDSLRSMSPLALPETSFVASKAEGKGGKVHPGTLCPPHG